MTSVVSLFVWKGVEVMETLTQGVLGLLANINENVSPYKEISLKPLQEGNDIVARILSVEDMTREYVNRTKRNVGVLVWVLAKHESSITAMDTLLKVKEYILQQRGSVVQDVQWETTSEDTKDVYSIICKLSI